MVDSSGAVDLRRAYQDAHKAADTDFESHSIHHTLGAGPRQAAPGNHKHDDLIEMLNLLIPITTIIATAADLTGYDMWLPAVGDIVLRADHPELFDAIGTTYNTGGETILQFRLPNAKGRAIMGLDPAQTEFDTLGKTGGAKTHVLTTAQMPVHNHTTTISSDSHSHTTTTWGHALSGTGAAAVMRHTASGASNTYNIASTSDAHSHTATVGNAGSGNAHPILSPYITMNPYIKRI